MQTFVDTNPCARKYKVNEIFYSLQGEGLRAGEPSVFLRFAKCNLRCRKETHGFDCDTEFESFREYELNDLVREVMQLAGPCRWIVLTGGEPTLQVDEALIDAFHAQGFKLAIETNGTQKVNKKIDWITVSPKPVRAPADIAKSAAEWQDEFNAQNQLRQTFAHEVKVVRAKGQPLPVLPIRADHYLVSPAFEDNRLVAENVGWCIELAKQNPQWRVSLQQHKILKIR